MDSKLNFVIEYFNKTSALNSRIQTRLALCQFSVDTRH